MLQKHDLRYYGLILILGIGAIYFNKPFLTFILMLVSMVAWLIRDFKVENKIDKVETDLDQKKQQADVRAEVADTKLKRLINAIPSPLTYVNQRGDFEVSNVNFTQMVEISPKNVYDSTIDSPLRQIMLDAFLNEKQFIRLFNYNDVDYQVHSIPILDEKRYNGCMIIFQDVTRVTEGEKRQERFIADASHELNRPIGDLQNILASWDNTDTTHLDLEQKEQIIKQMNRLESIVKDLLLQSKLKANQVFLEKTVFNLRQFFEGIIHERRQKLHQKDIKVRLNCPSNITILADQFRLTQVFLNLMDNSINYAENGHINIDCELWNDVVTISFSDDGKGIKNEKLPNIFKRFYRDENAQSRSMSGSGLGLAITKSIIKAHGGNIEVESVYGKGTTFTIKIDQ